MSYLSLGLRPRLPPVTRFLLVSAIGMYLAQVLVAKSGDDVVTQTLSLSVSGFMTGEWWTLFTYLFLHGGPLHLLFNMMMLYFLGGEVERAVGSLHTGVLYMVSGVLGGLGWVLLSPYEGFCVGASGAIFGLLGAFAVLFPQREVTLLVFMIIPVTMRAWVLALGLGVIQLLFMISPVSGGIAYSAHLAGGVAGAAYTIALFRRDLLDGVTGRWRSVRAARRAQSDELLRGEVDALLDKVARDGLHALTPSERRKLEQASARLHGR